MTKKERFSISVGAMIGGFLLCASASTTAITPPFSTMFIVIGLIVAVGGFISLVLAVRGRS